MNCLACRLRAMLPAFVGLCFYCVKILFLKFNISLESHLWIRKKYKKKLKKLTHGLFRPDSISCTNCAGIFCFFKSNKNYKNKYFQHFSLFFSNDFHYTCPLRTLCTVLAFSCSCCFQWRSLWGSIMHML